MWGHGKWVSYYTENNSTHHASVRPHMIFLLCIGGQSPSTANLHCNIGHIWFSRFHQQNLWNRVNHQKVQTPNSTWTMRIPDSVPNATWEGGAVCGALASLVQETRPFGKIKRKNKKVQENSSFPSHEHLLFPASQPSSNEVPFFHKGEVGSTVKFYSKLPISSLNNSCDRRLHIRSSRFRLPFYHLFPVQ